MSVQSDRKSLGFVLRFVAGFLLVCVVGVAAWPHLPRHYRSSASFVLLVSHRDESPGAAVKAERQLPDESETQSDVELLSSPELATKVIDASGLMRDPEFATPMSWLSRSLRTMMLRLARSEIVERMTSERALDFVKALFPPPGPVTPGLVREKVMKHLDVNRDKRSYTVNFGFWSQDPRKAQILAQSYLDAYIALQNHRRQKDVQRIDDWLEARLGDVQEQSRSADRAVKQLMESSGLIDVGGQASLESQLATLSSQLAMAQSAAIEASTRSTMLNSMRANRTLQDAPDVIASPVVQALKQRYGSAMDAAFVDNQVMAESNHIVAGAATLASLSLQRVVRLEQTITGVRRALQARTEAQLRLNALQREAKAAHATLESTLIRLGDQTALVRAISPDVMVVEKPDEPWKPAFPDPLLGTLAILTWALLAGLACAFRFRLPTKVQEPGSQAGQMRPQSALTL